MDDGCVMFLVVMWYKWENVGEMVIGFGDGFGNGGVVWDGYMISNG